MASAVLVCLLALLLEQFKLSQDFNQLEHGLVLGGKHVLLLLVFQSDQLKLADLAGDFFVKADQNVLLFTILILQPLSHLMLDPRNLNILQIRNITLFFSDLLLEQVALIDVLLVLRALNLLDDVEAGVTVGVTHLQVGMGAWWNCRCLFLLRLLGVFRLRLLGLFLLRLLGLFLRLSSLLCCSDDFTEDFLELKLGVSLISDELGIEGAEIVESHLVLLFAHRTNNQLLRLGVCFELFDEGGELFRIDRAVRV